MTFMTVTIAKTRLWRTVMPLRESTREIRTSKERAYLNWCLINVYPHCEQFVKYECFVSALIDDFLLSPNSEKMTYLSGAAHEEHMCACA